MARGLVIGQVVDGDGDALSDAQVSLSAVRGADSNGILVSYRVPKVEVNGLPIEQRVTNDDGVFVIPFEWNAANPDDLARVAATDVLEIKVTVITDSDNKTFEGSAVKVPDMARLLDNIKSGQMLQTASGQEILDALKPEFRGAVSGGEFNGIPFTMLSTDQVAIVGVLPGLTF